MAAPTPRAGGDEIRRRRDQQMAGVKTVREQMVNGEISPTGTIRRSRMFEVFSQSRESIAEEVNAFGSREHALATLEGRMSTYPEQFQLNERRAAIFSRAKPTFKISRRRACGIISKMFDGGDIRDSSRSRLGSQPKSRSQASKRRRRLRSIHQGGTSASSETLLSAWSADTGEDDVQDSPPQIALALPRNRLSAWFSTVRASVSRRKSSAANSLLGNDDDASVGEQTLLDRQKSKATMPDMSQRPREVTFLRRASNALLSSFGGRNRNDSTAMGNAAIEEAREKGPEDHHQVQATDQAHRLGASEDVAGQSMDFPDASGGEADVAPDCSLRDDEDARLKFLLWAEDIGGVLF